MKTILILLIASAFCYSVQAQTIPNGDFESGKDTLSLDNWNTMNEITQIFFPFNRTTDAYSGEYAAKLETINIFGTLVPGIATFGEISVSKVNGSIHFPYRPEKLTGYFKHPEPQDESLIWVYFLKNHGSQTDTIGEGRLIPPGNIKEYQAFEIDIVYNSEETPDSMNLILLSALDVANTTFYVDKLEFLYGTSVTDDSEYEIALYPNPARDIINISNSSNNPAKVEIRDICGRALISTEFNTEKLQIPVDMLTTGQYFARIINGNNNQTIPFVILK